MTDVVSLSPKLCLIRIIVIRAGFQIFIKKTDKFDIFDTVRIQKWCAIIEIEQSFKIYVKIVLIVDDGRGGKL